jgi:hypothetical protein
VQFAFLRKMKLQSPNPPITPTGENIQFAKYFPYRCPLQEMLEMKHRHIAAHQEERSKRSRFTLFPIKGHCHSIRNQIKSFHYLNCHPLGASMTVNLALNKSYIASSLFLYPRLSSQIFQAICLHHVFLNSS